MKMFGCKFCKIEKGFLSLRRCMWVSSRALPICLLVRPMWQHVWKKQHRWVLIKNKTAPFIRPFLSHFPPFTFKLKARECKISFWLDGYTLVILYGIFNFCFYFFNTIPLSLNYFFKAPYLKRMFISNILENEEA